MPSKLVIAILNRCSLSFVFRFLNFGFCEAFKALILERPS